MMKNGWKVVAMHLSALIAAVILALKGNEHLATVLVSVWFAFMDKSILGRTDSPREKSSVERGVVK